MSIIIAAALAAAAQPLPWINRDWLDGRARVEALQPRPAAISRAAASAIVVPVRKRSAKSLLSNDLNALSTVCDAAAKLRDAGFFLDSLGAAYAMEPGEISALKENCALDLVGRAR
ncbi:MAG: hypothetical protein JWN69_2474 [Alphaproteobacteria bacterium]|nr:hypothetical protein [Alphaproteobacteria bacterium]